jgi:hypothetical protein
MDEADIHAKLTTVFDDDSINVASGSSTRDVNGWGRSHS